MACTHHIVKCINCVKYCEICGARLDTPAEAATEAKAAATERPKRKASKKGATKA